MRIITKLLAGAAMLTCASAASAADYIKYEILTSGTGYFEDARSGAAFRLSGMGFTFVVPMGSSPLSWPSPGGNGVNMVSTIFDLGFAPGPASATFAGNVLSLLDVSGDHSFTANVCSPTPLAALPMNSFATASNCSNTVSFSANSYRGSTWTYTGQTVELRTTLFTSDGSGQAGLTLLSAVPEPATWAMMLIGLGMVAGGARYRRRSTSISIA